MTDALVPAVDAGAAFGPRKTATPDPNALTVPVDDWAAMPDAERGAKIPRLVARFRRRSLIDSWHIGCGLRAHKHVRTGRDWRAYLDSIGMERTMARRLLTLATAESGQIAHFKSEAALLQSLKLLPPAPEPVEPTPEAAPVPSEATLTAAADPDPVPAVVVEPEPVVVDPVLVDDHEPVEPYPEAVAAEVAAEHELTPAELRDERLERLAIVTEDLKDDIVDHWARKHSEAAERHQRDARRHREDVAAVNGERRRRLAAERKLEDFIDALLAVPHGEGDKAIDDLLASRGVARKAA